MASTTSTPLATLKLQTNVPEVIALMYADGRPCQSQYSGDQVMFSLEDGRKFYAAPAVAKAMQDAGVSAHVPFEICKREVTVGNRRTLRHEIRVLESENETSAAVLPAAAPARFPVQREAVAKSVESSTPQSSAERSECQREGAKAPRPALVPNRERAEAIAAELAAELAKPAEQQPEPGGRLFACYKHAIDCAAAAKRYASERGMLIEPKFEDVRQMAATLYIDGRRA